MVVITLCLRLRIWDICVCIHIHSNWAYKIVLAPEVRNRVFMEIANCLIGAFTIFIMSCFIQCCIYHYSGTRWGNINSSPGFPSSSDSIWYARTSIQRWDKSATLWIHICRYEPSTYVLCSTHSTVPFAQCRCSCISTLLFRSIRPIAGSTWDVRTAGYDSTDVRFIV